MKELPRPRRVSNGATEKEQSPTQPTDPKDTQENTSCFWGWRKEPQEAIRGNPLGTVLLTSPTPMKGQTVSHAALEGPTHGAPTRHGYGGRRGRGASLSD